MYAYDVRLARSTDDGKSWSPPFVPHSDGTKTEHGFVSLFELPGSGLGLIWLDGRAMTGGHEGHGDMSLRAGAFDRSWKQNSADSALDPRALQCCPTAAAMTADGPIAAYRDRSADEVRDIYVTRLEKGKWTQRRRVHQDGWPNQCVPGQWAIARRAQP